VLLASMVACRPVENIILPKFHLQLQNVNGSNLGINIDKRKHQWIFLTMQGHFKFLQAQNGMYVEDNNMNQHHQHYPRLCDHKIMDLVFKLHHVVPDPN
jgi:hypothetical protein